MMIWLFVGLLRSHASMCWWVDSVDVTQVPTDTTFAFKISGSSLPGAMRAVNDTVTIFDFELNMARIDNPFAGRASE